MNSTAEQWHAERLKVMRKLIEMNWKQSDIAKLFGISRQRVHQILRGG